LILVESRLDIRLARVALEWAGIEDKQKLLRRCLEILEAIAASCRIKSALTQLLECPDAHVRSKAVDLLVRSSPDEANVRDWLLDRDPRIRANVLESLGEVGGEMTWSRKILLEHLNDPHGRVAANSAVGLYRLGMEEAALARLSEMASSEEPSVRCSAAWAMGQTPNANLLEVLRQLRTDPAPQVRWHALKSLSALHRAGAKAKQDAADELPQNQAEEPASAEAQLHEADPDLPEADPEPGEDEEADEEPGEEPRVFHTRTFGRLI
jgi:HEAT repeat protein